MRSILSELSVLVAGQPSHSSKPEAAVFTFSEPVSPYARQTLVSSHWRHDIVFDPCKTSARTEDVYAAIPSLNNALCCVGRELFLGRNRREFGVAEAVQPACRPHPEAAFPILIQGEYPAIAQAIRRAKRRHFTACQAQQTSCGGPYPEVSLMVLESRVHLATDGAAGDPLRHAPVLSEPIEAIRRANP